MISHVQFVLFIMSPFKEWAVFAISGHGIITRKTVKLRDIVHIRNFYNIFRSVLLKTGGFE